MKSLYLCLCTGSEEDSERNDLEDTMQCACRIKKAIFLLIVIYETVKLMHTLNYSILGK